MPTHRSDMYHFPRGDLVLQVEDTVFKLHRDILEIHSAFFRDMFSTPTSNPEEGTTDDNPLHLPKDLSTAQSFDTLCKFLYPRELGIFPDIRVKELSLWEPVLEATLALQIPTVHNYILTKFEEDKPDNSKEVVKLLGWALRVGHKGLELECFRTLAYRRRPPSQAEGTILGGKAIARVTFIRERVRTVLLASSGSLNSSIRLHNSCSSRANCQNYIFGAIVSQLNSDPVSDTVQDDLEIFQIDANTYGVCYYCKPTQADFAASLKEERLDKEIRRCFEALESQNADK